MLQRAASSARSWWWASHIRTKQSNWLDQNLQEMETRVQAMIKLIDEDGDSFAKRAEMYYKRRPELIHFVEEFFRAYKALADRYDHISGELHNARSTIATAFPDKVSVEHTEDHSKGKVDPGDDLAGFSNALSNKPPPPPPPSLEKKPLSNTPKVEMTDLSNYEHAMDVKTAQKEIDKLQKEILALIMEKEFIKSSYEAGLAKYWEIEKQILELQATVCFLQEEHGLSSSIEADEEQTIMAVTALNSCEQILGNLQEEQLKAKAEAKIESQRIMIMEEKLKVLKDEFLKRHPEEHKLDEKATDAHPTIKTLEEEVCNLRKEKTEYQEICHKIVKHLEIDANDSLTLPEYGHLIDDLVTKVVDLETEVSTQNVQMMRMKSEADHLQENLQSLQEDKMLLLDDSKTMSERIKDLEEELYGIQHLNLHIEEQKAQLETQLTEACTKLEGLTERLKSRQDHCEGKISASLKSGSESTVKLSQEKNANETSSGHQNQTDDDLASVQSEVESAFELPQEKTSNETSAGHQNQKDDEDSASVQSGVESAFELPKEKTSNETSAGHQNQKDDEDSASVKSGVESAFELPQEKTSNETSVGHQNQKDDEDSASVQSVVESAFDLPQEKTSNETSAGHQNYKERESSALVKSASESSDEFLQEKDVEGTSAGNQIHDECENLSVDKKGADETSASLDSHDECERSALVQSERESTLHFPGEKHADESSSSHNKHIEGERPALAQPGTEFAVQVPGRKYVNETLPIEAREEKDVTVGSQDERDLKDGAQTEESNLKTGLHVETGKPKFGYYEGELQEETNSKFHYEAKYLMQQETDNQSKSIANRDHEVKQGVESGTDHQSTSIDNALENLSLELVDAQSWQTFLEGMEDREKTLLSEYTSILRTYRETKRKLSELEKQNQDLVAEKTEKIRLLQMESAQKDGEIQSLKQQLGFLQADYDDQDSKSIQGKDFESKPSRSDDSNALLVLDGSDHENVRDPEDHSARNGIDPLPTEKEIQVLFSQNTGPPSAMEDKFRREIDSLLEENLEFWLRFSASFHQIQKFQTTVQEAQVELLKLKKEKTNDEGANSSTTTTSSNKDNQNMKTNVELIQKQLTELQGELIIWLEQNALLKEELNYRSSSLSDIQEELTQVSKVKSKNGEAELTVYEAAKFQGEVSNMQQENNKVADELQAGLDHVRGLQLELEKALLKLKENFGLQESKRHHHHYYQLSYVRNTLSRRVPLRSILTFAGKPPKRSSLFSCVNPALQKQYSDLRAAGLQK